MDRKEDKSMNKTIKLAGPNREGNYQVMETTNYLQVGSGTTAADDAKIKS